MATKRRWLRNTVEWGGNFSNVWGLLPAAWQTLVTAGLTALTAYFGIHEVGLAQAIFYASGVLAFGMTTVFLSLRIAQILGMFQRLTVASFGIASISVVKNNTEIEHINFNTVLRNDSQRPMFYRLKRAHAVVEHRAPLGDAVDPNIIIIPAFGGTQIISFPTIQHVPITKGKAPAGQIEIEVEYGVSADDLEFHLREVVTLGISILTPSGTKQQHAQLFTQIKILEHTRK